MAASTIVREPWIDGRKAAHLASSDRGGRHELPRRRFLHLAAGAAALPGLSRIAWAQTYPSRPVRLIVGFAAGGAADILARLIGQWLSERLGQPFVIENRPGAGTNIATEAVVRAPPDGYTLLLVNAANAINATLYEKLNFNFIRDIAPVARHQPRVTIVMVVHPSVPAKTVPEFIAYAKANPGKINMASGGIGAPSHMAGELFKMMAGVNMVHVPYRGAAPALTDLLGGQVQVYFGPMPSSIEYIKAGKLRALAVTTATRSEVLPDIPTVGEFLPGFEASTWFGIGAPKNTPAEIIDKAQQGDQRGPRRSQDQGAACRPGRHGTSRLARRLREAYRRRNREVGQGDQVRGHQSELSGFRSFGARALGAQPRDGGAQLGHAGAVARRRRQHLGKSRGMFRERHVDRRDPRLEIGRLHLVGLGQHELVVHRRLVERPQHGVVHRLEAVPGIHQQIDARQVGAAGEEGMDQLGPGLHLGLGGGGVAVARHVDQCELPRARRRRSAPGCGRACARCAPAHCARSAR